MKRWLNLFFRNIKNALLFFSEFFRLPHIIITFVLLLFAVVSIFLAKYMQQRNPFLSSMLSNVFAGLITGIAIYLISGTKNIFKYKTKKMIDFLKEVHSKCLSFLNAYGKMIKRTGNSNKSRDGFYDEIYDALCKGNDIDVTISQSQFDKVLPFNPYRYFVKKIKYDAIEQLKKNELLRDVVLSIDADTISYKELIDLFKEMEMNILSLNGKVLAKIGELEIKQNISEKLIV